MENCSECYYAKRDKYGDFVSPCLGSSNCSFQQYIHKKEDKIRKFTEYSDYVCMNCCGSENDCDSCKVRETLDILNGVKKAEVKKTSDDTEDKYIMKGPLINREDYLNKTFYFNGIYSLKPHQIIEGGAACCNGVLPDGAQFRFFCPDFKMYDIGFNNHKPIIKNRNEVFIDKKTLENFIKKVLCNEYCSHLILKKPTERKMRFSIEKGIFSIDKWTGERYIAVSNDKYSMDDYSTNDFEIIDNGSCEEIHSLAIEKIIRILSKCFELE